MSKLIFGTSVYVATVHHRHGSDTFLNNTEAGRRKALARFCRSWWDELDLDHEAPEDDEKCVREYFDNHPTDTCDFSDAVLGE